MRKKLLGSAYPQTNHFSFFDLSFSVSLSLNFLLTCPLYADCKPNVKMPCKRKF